MFIRISAPNKSRDKVNMQFENFYKQDKGFGTQSFEIIRQYVYRGDEKGAYKITTLEIPKNNGPGLDLLSPIPYAGTPRRYSSNDSNKTQNMRQIEYSSYNSYEIPSDNPRIERPIEKLIQTTTKLFFCTSLELNDIDLNTSEICLLKEIINKKFANKSGKYNKFCFKQKNKEEILTEINNFFTLYSSTKRIEENNKFVYKYTLKYLRNQFYIKEGLIKNNDNEILFYRYYFKNIAENLNVPLEYFFDPLYKTSNKNPFYKSINNKYLSLIFSSSHFKSDFFTFLKKDFRDTYSFIISSKLKKFFKILRSDLMSDRSGKYNDVLIERFANKLRKNKKCKLPWTIIEVDNALTHFNSLIYYY